MIPKEFDTQKKKRQVPDEKISEMPEVKTMANSAREIIKGTPTKLLILDDETIATMKANKARGVGVALVGFLSQVNIVFDFDTDGKAAKEFFDSFKESGKYDRKLKRVVPI